MRVRKVSQRSVARMLKAGKPLAGLLVGLSSTLGAAERELSGLAIRGEPGPIVTAAKTGCTNGASNVATKMRSTNSVEEGRFEVTAGLIPMTDELRAEREKMRAEAFGVSFLRKFRVFPKPPGREVVKRFQREYAGRKVVLKDGCCWRGYHRNQRGRIVVPVCWCLDSVIIDTKRVPLEDEIFVVEVELAPDVTIGREDFNVLSVQGVFESPDKIGDSTRNRFRLIDGVIEFDRETVCQHPVFDEPSTLIRSTQVWSSDFPMSPSEFAASLKAGKGYAGGYVPMRKGPCGAVFYVFVHNLNRRQSLGELVKGSPHFESLEALELFEKIYVQSGMRCWRMEPGNFDPDPQGVYFYADENP